MNLFHKSFHRNDTEFMSPRAAAKHGKPHHFARMTFLVISTLIVCFLIWASFSEIDVVTRGTGRVIPSQKIQVIANLEGGIIKEILVKEGDIVEAGQVLARLDPTIQTSLYKTNKEQYSRYLTTVARLEAQLKGEDFQVPKDVQTDYPSIAEEEMKHFQDRKKQLETQIGIAKQNALQKKDEVIQAKEKITQSQDQLRLAEEELTMVSPLAVQQLISKREMLRLQRDVANLKGEVATGKATLSKAEAALVQAQTELEQVPIRFKNEDEDQMKDVMIKLAQEHGATLESGDRLKRTELRSPVKGIVNEVRFKTVGGVVRAADEIMTIVPYEDTLLVEANIIPSDVAFTRVGQEATVKIMAYDYSIYGSLKGQLIEISADTVHDPDQKKDFYRILVRTDKNYLVHEGKKLAIIPGMTAEVDVLTGTRTIMQYLLKPILRGTTSSLTER